MNLSASNNQIRATVTYNGKPLHDANALTETSDWKTPQVFNGWTDLQGGGSGAGQIFNLITVME